MKLRIFVDFWNFQLNIINQVNDPNYRVDWNMISPWILKTTRNLINDETLTFEEMRVYMSYNPRKPDDKKLKDWATNTLDRFPGVNVILTERKIKNTPKCPACHKELDPCPHCGEPTNGSVEKGVDTALATDMIVLAWEKAWDVAVLISSDRDFIPAVSMLGRKGCRVINAHFPSSGMDLSRNCWANINLINAVDEIALAEKYRRHK